MKQAQSLPFNFFSTTPFSHTLAESCINLMPNLTTISEKWLERLGASKVVEMTGPQIVCDGCVSGIEVGPLNFSTSECDYVLYQFKDGSLLWYVRGNTDHYLQLRGMYNGKFRHTNYIKAGERVTEYGIKYEYPLIWDDDIWTLEVTVTIHNLLAMAGIRHIGELVGKSKFDLLKIKGFGSVKMSSLLAEMEKRGLAFDTVTAGWKPPTMR